MSGCETPTPTCITEGSISRLSQKDVRLLAEELETGRGGLGELVARKPGLGDLSRQALYEEFGPVVPLFRVVALHQGDDVRPEEVVSTTVNPEQLLQIASGTAGAYWTTDSMVVLHKVLLRYDVPVEAVIVDVATLCALAWEQQADFLRTTKIPTRRHEYVTAAEVLEAFCREREVIANVSGIVPSAIIEYPSSSADRIVVEEVAGGTWKGGRHHVRWLKDNLRTRYDIKTEADRLVYWPEGEKLAAADFNAVARGARSFFRGTV